MVIFLSWQCPMIAMSWWYFWVDNVQWLLCHDNISELTMSNDCYIMVIFLSWQYPVIAMSWYHFWVDNIQWLLSHDDISDNVQWYGDINNNLSMFQTYRKYCRKYIKLVIWFRTKAHRRLVFYIGINYRNDFSCLERCEKWSYIINIALSTVLPSYYFRAVIYGTMSRINRFSNRHNR